MFKKIDMKKYLKIFVNYLLPVFAIVISFISLYYSYESNEIAQTNLELNYSPIADIDFKIDNFKNKYSLIIFNDGPNSLYEVKIKTLSRLYHKGKQKVGVSTNTEEYWKFIQEIKPSQKKEFSIDFDDLENTFNIIYVVGEDSIDFVLPVQLYYVTFRRRPDRSIYKIKKYLFLHPNYNKKIKSSFIVIDPEKHFFEENKDIKKHLEIYDAEIL